MMQDEFFVESFSKHFVHIECIADIVWWNFFQTQTTLTDSILLFLVIREIYSNIYKMDIKLDNTIMVNGTILSFFLECSINPNCSISSTSAAELDSNLIWIYTDWQSPLFTSLYFGLLEMLWFTLLPISVVPFYQLVIAYINQTNNFLSCNFLSGFMFTSAVQTFWKNRNSTWEHE